MPVSLFDATVSCAARGDLAAFVDLYKQCIQKVDLICSENTPLEIAALRVSCKAGRMNIARHLLSLPVWFLCPRSRFGKCDIYALHDAIQARHVDIAIMLVRLNSHPPILGGEALVLATQTNQPDMMDFLLHNSCRVALEDSDKYAALLAAVRCGHQDALKCLVKHGVALQSPKQVLELAVSFQHTHLVEFLFDSHLVEMDSLESSAAETSVVELAAQTQNMSLLACILPRVENLEHLDKAMTVAIYARHNSMVRVLFQHMQKCGRDLREAHPFLSQALWRKHYDTFSLLLELGIRPCAKQSVLLWQSLLPRTSHQHASLLIAVGAKPDECLVHAETEENGQAWRKAKMCLLEYAKTSATRLERQAALLRDIQRKHTPKGEEEEEEENKHTRIIRVFYAQYMLQH